MTSEQVDAFGLKVVNVGRDGKRRYDRQAKQRLIEACLMPNVSVAGLALQAGINANLLRKWIKLYQQRRVNASANAQGVAVTTPFVEVVNAGESAIAHRPIDQRVRSIAQRTPSEQLSAHLSAQMLNGITLKLSCGADGAALITAMIDALGRCDVPSGR